MDNYDELINDFPNGLLIEGTSGYVEGDTYAWELAESEEQAEAVKKWYERNGTRRNHNSTPFNVSDIDI